jgi:HNH endonuclease
MPGAGVRALARDVFFYDLRDLSTLLGGLVLSPGVTNANFYAMIDIVLVIPSTYFLQDDNGETLPRDSQPLPPGNYFIVADGAVNVADEVVVTRTESLSTGTRILEFKDQVRERDKRCVITKTINPRARFGIWGGFEAAHIFPLAYERYWIDNNFSRWISLPPSQGGTINSVQNGLLLRADIHTDFDHFYISINPDVCMFPFHSSVLSLTKIIGWL